MRTSRTDGTTTYKYVYNGGSLVQMTVGSNTLYFTSDTVTYNGVTYYYVKNLQGDVTAIVDGSGATVATYVYDAWGNLISDEPAENTIGHLNPIRYRGYIFDSESDLYYLQSRYYDPELGRFLNADALVSTEQGILGNNAFAYCNNCPILYYDPSGKALDTIWDAFTLALSIVEVINDPSNPEAWIGLALDAVDLIPFLTGTGEVYRAYRVADRLAEGFGNLTKAKEYGIMGYNALKKVLKGTGLEAHHIIEQRLVKHLGIDISNMLSVAVTKSEHQVFTKHGERRLRMAWIIIH